MTLGLPMFLLGSVLTNSAAAEVMDKEPSLAFSAAVVLATGSAAVLWRGRLWPIAAVALGLMSFMGLGVYMEITSPVVGGGIYSEAGPEYLVGQTALYVAGLSTHVHLVISRLLRRGRQAA